MEGNSKDIKILGAGPTGLGVSLGLLLNNSSTPVTVIEKSERVGGLAGSFAWKGHTIDFGPHRLSPNIDSIRVLAQELLGPDCLYEKSQHGVQLKGKLYQFPPRITDWVSPASFWQLLSYVVSYFFSKILWVTKRFNTETFTDLIIHRFGKRFFQQIVAPMTEKVWASPTEIDPSFVAQRFSVIRLRHVMKKIVFPKQDLNPSHFIYPRHGFQQLWDHAKSFSATNGHVFYTQSQPTAIHLEGSLASRLEFQDATGNMRSMDLSQSILVSTIPITAFLQSLRVEKSDLDVDNLRNLAKQIKFRSMILVCLEFDKETVLPFRTQIYPEKTFVFNRLFEQNRYSRETVETGKGLVVADITYPKGGWADKSTDEELIELTLKDMRKLRYIPLDKLTDTHVRRVAYAYVVPDTAGKRAMFSIRHELKRLSNVQFAGRFSVGEYDNSDYALMNGMNLAGFLSNRISRMEYLRRIHLQFNPIIG